MYALHNAPIWIPIHAFKKCSTIFHSLIWSYQVPCIKLETLQEANDSGRLAVPNPYYYLAARLQHLTGWPNPGSSDLIINIVCTQLSGDDLLKCIEMGELGTLSEYPMLGLIDRIWYTAKQHFHYMGYTNWSYIWNNRNYPKLGKLQGFSAWSGCGIVYVPQLYQGCLLRDFQSLRMEFGLPNTLFFQYLQLRYSISAQAKLPGN